MVSSIVSVLFRICWIKKIAKETNTSIRIKDNNYLFYKKYAFYFYKNQSFETNLETINSKLNFTIVLNPCYMTDTTFVIHE